MFVFKPILLLMKEMKLILKKLLFGEKNSKNSKKTISLSFMIIIEI